MSLSSSLSTAISGMTAATKRAEVVSSNIANAMTEGYARRTLETASGRIGGVQIIGVTRVVDRGILADRRLAGAEQAGLTDTASTLQRLEAVTGTVDSESNLASLLADFEEALVSASSDPSADVRLSTAVSKLKTVTKALNKQSDAVQSLRAEADASIADQVKTLNSSLSQIEKLNADIVRSNATGMDASSLLDQRQQLIDTVSEIVPLRELEGSNGTVRLVTQSGMSLLDGKARTFGFEESGTVSSASILSGLTLDGEPITSSQFTKMEGGSLSAAFVMRDTTLPEVQNGLDQIAYDLISRFQSTDTDPTLGAADAGLLTDAGSSVDGSYIVGLASRISVNEAVDPDTGGEVWRLRDGIGAVTQGDVSDSSQIDRFSDALVNRQSLSSGGAERTASEHISSFLSDLATERLGVEDDLSFVSARWDTLQEAELANGVDTDSELENLMLIEQSYAANAQLIQTISSMFDSLLEI